MNKLKHDQMTNDAIETKNVVMEQGVTVSTR